MIVQYIILRSDLIKNLKWSAGAVIIQVSHACTAVVHLFHNDPHTQTYLSDLDNMHKVLLEVPNEENLKTLSTVLNENCIDHKLWIEQPENIPTCIVLKPYPKNQIHQYLKKFKLYK